jgi:hypothetical protein
LVSFDNTIKNTPYKIYVMPLEGSAGGAAWQLIIERISDGNTVLVRGNN